METLQRRSKALKAVVSSKSLASLILLMCSIVASVQAAGEMLQLDCIERDWFTVFGKQSSDITSFEMAVTDSTSTDMTRLVVAISEETSEDETNSYLAYLDYLTCEQFFFLKNDNAYQAGLFSVAVYTDDMSSAKQYETIYEVGKAQDASAVIVTIIELETIQTISFDFDALDYSNSFSQASFYSKTALTVIQADSLLWTHPLGQMILDLNLMVARTIHYSSNLQVRSLQSIIGQNDRYITAMSWDWSSDGTDVIWINGYDFGRFMGSTQTPTLTISQKFDLGEQVQRSVPGFHIAADSYEDSVALCYSTESQSDLVFALWQAGGSYAYNIYTATMSNTLAQKVNGCASIQITVGVGELQRLTALVYTTDNYLSLLDIQFGMSTAQSLEQSDSVSMSVVMKQSSQKFVILEKPGSNLHFRAVPGFISMNTQHLWQEDKWAFILNTDVTALRRTQLWVLGNQRSATWSKISAPSDEEDFQDNIAEWSSTFETQISRSQTGQRQESVLTRWAYQFNAWVAELCDQPDKITSLSDHQFELAYPSMQEFDLYFDEIIDTKYDRQANSWLRTCFPNVAVQVPEGSAHKFGIVDFDETSARLQVEKVPSAKVYAGRYTLLGQDTDLRFFERIVYNLQLQASLGSQYSVAYENQPPRITDPEPFNNQIFISVQWAPNPLLNKVALMEDVDGKNWDTLYVSGPIFDLEGDQVNLEVLNLTRVFKFELTNEGRVAIKMKIKMEPQFTGLHVLYFQLTGNEKVEGPPNVYQANIAVGLYDADPIAHKKRVIKYKERIGKPEIQVPSENTVPARPEINSSDEWWQRRPYSERKAQLRVAPFSSDGYMKVSFTKPVVLPENIVELIMDQNLVNITFVPSVYDFETDDEDDKTDIKDWSIKEMSEDGMLIKIVFQNPNMLSYSIHETDLFRLSIDLTSIHDDGSSDELFGKYVKSVPLQYPEQFSASGIYELNQAIELAPYVIFMLLFLCFILLVVSTTIDKTAVIWVIVTNLPMLILLPIMNVPIPAQINEISKGLAKYLRMDFIQLTDHGQSLTTVVAQFIFDFPAESLQIPLHLEQMGFNSINSLQSASGLNLLHCVIVVPILFLLMIFGLVKCLTKKKCSSIAFTKLRSVFSNNFYVRYNMETFVVYSICYLMSVPQTSFYNWMKAFQSTLSGIHLLLLGTLPLSIIFFYNWNYERLVKSKIFRQKWGSLYLGLIGDEEKTKRTIAYKYPALQLSRKFIFTFFVVILYDYWILQLGIMFLSSTFLIYTVTLYSPYQSRQLHRMQVMFDCTLVILSDFMISFNGGGFLSSDQNVRFEIGWGYLGVFLTCLSVAFLMLARITFIAVKRTMMVQVIKKSKQKKKLDKRKSKMARRQSVRMNSLFAMNAAGNSIPVMSVEEGGDMSSPNSGSLNSPHLSNRVIQQSTNDLLTVQKDNKPLTRGLTQIEESDEEDESSYFSGEESDLSATERDDNFYMQQPNSFVMGFEYLPKINRQQMMISKSPMGKKRNRSGPRLSGDYNTLPIIKDFIEMENRRQSSSPINASNQPNLLSQHKHKSHKQINRTLVHSAQNSSDEEGSFKASSRIKKTKKHSRNRSGHHTTKFEETGSNFTRHLQYKLNKQESTSQVDNQSSQPSDRHNMISQQDTRRGGTLVPPSQISNRSRQPYNYPNHPAGMSRRSRSSSIMIDDLDDDVQRKLAQMADNISLTRARKSVILTPSEANISDEQQAQKSGQVTPKKRRAAYVMGEQMARNSLIEDMTKSAMIMSKVVENNTSPIQKLIKNQSVELQYSLEKDFDPRRMQQKLAYDTRKTMKPSNKNNLPGHRLRRQSISMHDPPDVKDYLSGLRKTPVRDEKISERQQENSSSRRSKRQNVTSTDNDQSNPFFASNLVSESTTPKISPKLKEEDRVARGGKKEPEALKSYIDSEVDVTPPQSTPQQTPPLRSIQHDQEKQNVQQKQSKSDLNFRKDQPGPPTIQNLIIPDKPGQMRAKLTKMNIPREIHQKQESLDPDDAKSNRSNEELMLIVEHENQKFEKERQSRNHQQVGKQASISSPGVEETPQFQNKQLPSFSMNASPTLRPGLQISSSRKAKQDQQKKDQEILQFLSTMEKPPVAKRDFSFATPTNEEQQPQPGNTGNVEDLEIQRRRQSSKSSHKRPAEMPILNLNADNLLQGINRKVKTKMPPMRNISIGSIESDLSKMSKFSKFSIEDTNPESIVNNHNEQYATHDADDDFRSSPTNVKFNSMK